MAGIQVEKAQYRYGPQVVIPMPTTVVSALLAGDVVDLGNAVGVTLHPYNPATNDPRSGLCIMGIMTFLKETGAAINVGDTVLWDSGNQVAFVTGGGYTTAACIGMCVQAALSADLTVEVFMHPFAHTTSG